MATILFKDLKVKNYFMADDTDNTRNVRHNVFVKISELFSTYNAFNISKSILTCIEPDRQVQHIGVSLNLHAPDTEIGHNETQSS